MCMTLTEMEDVLLAHEIAELEHGIGESSCPFRWNLRRGGQRTDRTLGSADWIARHRGAQQWRPPNQSQAEFPSL